MERRFSGWMSVALCLFMLSGAAGGSSLRFFGNGTGQIDRVKVRIDTPGLPCNVGGDFTMEFWMRGFAAENSGVVTAQGNGDGWITGNVIIDRDVFNSGDYGDWGISVGSDGRIGFGVDRLGVGLSIVTVPGLTLDGAWHHVAVTRNASTGQMAIYVDGQRHALGIGPTGDISYRSGRTSAWPLSDPYLVFGAEKHDAADFFGGSYPSFSGWLDEVRLSRSVRYAGASFTRPAAPFITDEDTVGLWQFEEGEGDIIGDSSGAIGGPSDGVRAFGGSPMPGPAWSSDTPFYQAFLIDFGRNDFPTMNPDAHGRHWNNLTTDTAAVPSSNLFALSNIHGLSSSVGVSVFSFGAGANINGSTVPNTTALEPLGVASATRDSFYITAGTTATVTLSGLPAHGIYRLTLFGSRDESETRVTRVSAQGTGTPVAATVQTSGSDIGLVPEPNANRTFTAAVSQIQPTPSGVITLTLSVEEGSFGYLGAMYVEQTDALANTAPNLSGIGWEGAPRVGSTLQGRYIYMDADGDTESGTTFHWERSVDGITRDSIISGAEELTFSPALSDLGHYLRVVVTPRAATGVSPGLPIASAWRGPVGPAGARSVFHVGNSFTRWGDIPQQVAFFAGSRSQAHVWGEQLRDGEGLAYHWNNGLADGMLSRGTPSRLELPTASWDMLVLQPQSREFLPANQANLIFNAGLFKQVAETHGTRVFLLAYWPYLSEPITMQDDINTAFEHVRAALSVNGHPVQIIPAGEAFRRVVEEVAQGSLTGITRAGLYQDDLHPSDVGYYLSALVQYATLYQQSPVGLPAVGVRSDPNSREPVAIPSVLALELQRIAWQVSRVYPGSGITQARYNSWATEQVPEGERGLLDTPFGAPIPNLLRWAHGIPSPVASSTGYAPGILLHPSGFVAISYHVGADAEDAGVLLVEQWSSDGVSWTQPAPPGIVRSRSGNIITLIVPTSTEAITYFRTAVSTF